MGDSDPEAHHPRDVDASHVAATPGSGEFDESSAFHSQFEHLPQQLNHSHYGQQPFDMGALAGALPPCGPSSMSTRQLYGSGEAPGVLSPASIYQMQPATQFPVGQGAPFDPAAAARVQQQQYHNPQFGAMGQPGQFFPRQPQPYHMQGQYNQFDPYGYGMNPSARPLLDPRFPPQGPFGMGPNVSGDMPHTARSPSEAAVVPSFPRGPPRKPKQSGHALWVGNLPPAATVTDLKDHFSRDATKDIESLFLISKSNCAFVNYRSETACAAAMNRFHDSRFHGVRLVCRPRRGADAGPSPVTGAVETSGTPSSNDSPAGPASPEAVDEPASPVIVSGSSSAKPGSQRAEEGPPQKVPEKYFIVKSLTVQDLEASVRNGIWATQSHNESGLNRAYEEADNVYLIFSANKSGEYFGYARMASTITGEPVNLSSMSAQDETLSAGAPQSIPTPATATAPKGRIIDDSARGTIFWEADHSDEDDESSPEKDSREGALSGQNWGRQFAIEWMSTSRLPFYRTRGLRNPWNSNREVKIARDGTELEPSVGKRLVSMFVRPSPGPVLPQQPRPFR